MSTTTANNDDIDARDFFDPGSADQLSFSTDPGEYIARQVREIKVSAAAYEDELDEWKRAAPAAAATRVEERANLSLFVVGGSTKQSETTEGCYLGGKADGIGVRDFADEREN